jgi:hypothetical protein
MVERRPGHNILVRQAGLVDWSSRAGRGLIRRVVERLGAVVKLQGSATSVDQTADLDMAVGWPSTQGAAPRHVQRPGDPPGSWR